MIRVMLSGLAVLGLVASASVAMADVVDMEPDNCPDGSRGATCHGGPYCAPIECTSTCSGGKVCRDVNVCVGKIGCAGLLGPDQDPNDYLSTRIYSHCSATGGCSSGTCETRKLCVDPGSGGDDTTDETDTGSTSGTDTGDGSTVEGEGASDGCQAGRVGSIIAMSLALVLLALGAWFRRRDDDAKAA